MRDHPHEWRCSALVLKTMNPISWLNLNLEAVMVPPAGAGFAIALSEFRLVFEGVRHST